MSRSRPLVMTFAIATVALAIISSSARAHGDDDHGASAKPQVGAGDARRAETSSAALEAVLAVPTADASKPHEILLYLSDWATNAPVTGATVTLMVPDLDLTLGGEAVARAEGTYRFVATPGRAGAYSAILTVAAPGIDDLLSFDELTFGPAAHAHEVASRWPSWLPMLGLVALALVIVVIVLLSRRSKTAVVLGVAAFALVTLPHAFAHGDDDHGAGKAGATASTVAIVPKAAQFTFGIRTVLAERMDFPRRLELHGVVVAPPEARAEVTALQPGRVATVGGALPRVGDAVKRGQPLLTLEGAISAPERVGALTSLADARARRSSSEAELRVAERDLARIELVPEIVSQRERDAAASRVESARAAGEAARREVDILSAATGGGGSGSRGIVLESPIDGVITSAHVTLGEGVEAGRVFYTIINPSRLWVRADVPEQDAALVAQLAGSSARIVTGGDMQAEPVTARHVASTAGIDPATRSVAVYFETDNAERRLLEGMIVTAHVETSGTVSGFLLPASSIVTVSGRTLVFAHVQPEEFAPLDVVLGLRQGDAVEVLDGLHGGERVVTSGTYQVRAALLAGPR